MRICKIRELYRINDNNSDSRLKLTELLEALLRDMPKLLDKLRLIKETSTTSIQDNEYTQALIWDTIDQYKIHVSSTNREFMLECEQSAKMVKDIQKHSDSFIQ